MLRPGFNSLAAGQGQPVTNYPVDQRVKDQSNMGPGYFKIGDRVVVNTVMPIHDSVTLTINGGLRDGLVSQAPF